MTEAQLPLVCTLLGEQGCSFVRGMYLLCLNKEYSYFLLNELINKMNSVGKENLLLNDVRVLLHRLLFPTISFVMFLMRWGM